MHAYHVIVKKSFIDVIPRICIKAIYNGDIKIDDLTAAAEDQKVGGQAGAENG